MFEDKHLQINIHYNPPPIYLSLSSGKINVFSIHCNWGGFNSSRWNFAIYHNGYDVCIPMVGYTLCSHVTRNTSNKYITMTSQWARWRLKSPASQLLFNCSFRCRWRKTSKPLVTGLCEGNSSVTGEFPAQRDSHAEYISIWWRHHDALDYGWPTGS